jgi:hypothetical protein
VLLYIHHTYTVLLTVVVVGNIIPITLYIAFQVNALAVQLSLILMISLSQLDGVQVGAFIVNAAAKAVTSSCTFLQLAGVRELAEVLVLLSNTSAFKFKAVFVALALGIVSSLALTEDKSVSNTPLFRLSTSRLEIVLSSAFIFLFVKVVVRLSK